MSARDSKFAAAVEAWFVDAQRELPWRRVRNGYTALVSEAMLQQTQVARAVELYEPFMRRFPTVGALAEASEQEVLAAWQGLGYYGRARRLHAAARAIAERFEGEVPADIDALRSLPGVGRYTAGAIASIAFGARVPIVDTNVARVLMRVDARAGTSANPENVEWCWERAAQLVEACTNASHFNEGLMELGAIVCSSAAPKAMCVRSLARVAAAPVVMPLRFPHRRREQLVDACTTMLSYFVAARKSFSCRGPHEGCGRPCGKYRRLRARPRSMSTRSPPRSR